MRMRRGRAPSREPSGPGGPQWDDPNGQLPGDYVAWLCLASTSLMVVMGRYYVLAECF